MKSSLNINQLSSKRSFNINGYLFEYEKPLVMGILNMTPDSFYDGGKYNSIDSAISRVEGMINNGASIIDIGGCSTRPGSDIITIEEEWKRVGEIIKECSIRFKDTLFSVDTFRSEIARRSLEEGIHIINDVSGGSLDSEMFDVISKYNSPYILMHMKGKPKDMMSKTNYDDLILDLLNYFRKKINKLNSLGINDIILDNIKPNFTFLNLVNKTNLKIRLGKRKNLNRYDKFELNFYHKVQSGFIRLSKQNKKKYLEINSNNDISVNKKIILSKIDELI